MNLVIGGTGDLGRHVVRRLLSDGELVRVMTRDRTRAGELAAAGAEVVEGDLLDRASLERACEGATAVVMAAHSLFGRGRNASVHVDDRSVRTLMDVASAAGVDRFVYLSVYDFAPDFQAVPFFRIKYQMEEHLKASGLSWTIIRPTAFMESHAHLLLGAPVAAKGKVSVFGRGEQPRNFVAADDVARLITQALRDPAAAGRTLSIGGPGHHTNMDVVRIYERATGRTAKVSHVPLGVVRILSALTRPFHPGMSQVMQTAVLMDTKEQRFREAEGPEHPGAATTTLEEWVVAKLAQGSGEGPAGGGSGRSP